MEVKTIPDLPLQQEACRVKRHESFGRFRVEFKLRDRQREREANLKDKLPLFTLFANASELIKYFLRLQPWEA
eukprot:2246233-Amphidinium_carterae.1